MRVWGWWWWWAGQYLHAPHPLPRPHLLPPQVSPTVIGRLQDSPDSFVLSGTILHVTPEWFHLSPAGGRGGGLRSFITSPPLFFSRPPARDPHSPLYPTCPPHPKMLNDSVFAEVILYFFSSLYSVYSLVYFSFILLFYYFFSSMRSQWGQCSRFLMFYGF